MKHMNPNWERWLRGCVKAGEDGCPTTLTRDHLARLTGQDRRALAAVAACWQLYASSDEDGAEGALSAIRCLLPAMQRSAWPVARELIAYAMDWSDRELLWSKVVPRYLSPLPATFEGNQ
ncbi:MAG TPA: hypothetical protein VJO33_02410 [Gemmatimonadaceae bacterium]|nr:hypothetical protein [Gemmatimonadaceae bacterium]